MTLREYMSNPAGKGSAVPTEAERNKLDLDFQSLKPKMRCDRFIIKNKTAIFLISIPARSNSNVSYDVVFEMEIPESDAPSLLDIDFMVFSNCPSFVYTYAHVFYEKGLIPKWMTSKYPKAVLKKSATVRNQYNMVYYERSIYLAAKYIATMGYDKILSFKSFALPTASTRIIASKVQTFDTVMMKYNADKAKNKNKEEAAKKVKKPAKSTKSSDGDMDMLGSVTRTSKTTSIKKTSKTKKSKKI